MASIDVGGDDWQSDLPLMDACRHMLEREVATDVHFRVGAEKTSVRAHKFILLCRSSVFQVRRAILTTGIVFLFFAIKTLLFE